MLIKTLFKTIKHASTSLAYSMHNKNLDIPALRWEYKAKVEAEIEKHIQNLVQHQVELNNLKKVQEVDKKKLDTTLGEIRQGAVEKKAVAANQLKIVDTKEKAIKQLEGYISDYKLKISTAVSEKDLVVAQLSVASLQNDIADIDLSGGYTIQDILDVVEGKTLLIQAEKEIRGSLQEPDTDWLAKVDELL